MSSLARIFSHRTVLISVDFSGVHDDQCHFIVAAEHYETRIENQCKKSIMTGLGKTDQLRRRSEYMQLTSIDNVVNPVEAEMSYSRDDSVSRPKRPKLTALSLKKRVRPCVKCWLRKKEVLPDLTMSFGSCWHILVYTRYWWAVQMVCKRITVTAALYSSLFCRWGYIRQILYHRRILL